MLVIAITFVIAELLINDFSLIHASRFKPMIFPVLVKFFLAHIFYILSNAKIIKLTIGVIALFSVLINIDEIFFSRDIFLAFIGEREVFIRKRPGKSPRL